jgi:CRISPR-associated endoribonuclease Cas6
LTFGSLQARWEAFSPVGMPKEVRRYAEECLAISRYNLSSRSVHMKNGAVRKGAVGWIEYYALNPDRYWLALVNLLADFALYSGVGAGTSMGLGQVRRQQPVFRNDKDES